MSNENMEVIRAIYHAKRHADVTDALPPTGTDRDFGAARSSQVPATLVLLWSGPTSGPCEPTRRCAWRPATTQPEARQAVALSE
jgi:hypothetical protein